MKKRTRIRIKPSDFCMECCALLRPGTQVCQSCFCDNSPFARADISMDPLLQVFDDADFDDQYFDEEPAR